MQKAPFDQPLILQRLDAMATKKINIITFNSTFLEALQEMLEKFACSSHYMR